MNAVLFLILVVILGAALWPKVPMAGRNIIA
jgi:hypothetical protein